MPKRKQGEVDNEGVQDFELIELLIREAYSDKGTSSTSQGSDFESFKARFQSYIDQIPSYLHSVGKEGFFPHFFLGSFSTLIDTEIATKLDIEKIYFSFDGSKTLKVAVIKKEKITSPEDAANKVKLFVIGESDSTSKKFSYGELDKILDNANIVQNDHVRQARDKGMLGVKLVEITKKKDAKGKTAGISVEVKSDNLDQDTFTAHDFKEIKKGVWNNPESDIAELTNSDKKEVKKSLNKVLKKIGEVHSEYKGSLMYGEEKRTLSNGKKVTVQLRETAHHGFVAGALVNFRYRHNLRVYLEQFAGRGYADIVLVPRGEKRALDAIPIIIEMKAATKEELKELEKGGKIKDGSQTTPTAALKQAEDYTKGFQPNVMRVLTTANDILCVGVNLDHPSPISDIMDKSRNQKITPLFSGMLESIDRRNNGKIDEGELKKQIQNNIERIYHTFPGTGEKGDNHYFSRFLLGQSLLLNEVKVLNSNFEKHVFIYGENIPTETRSEGKERDVPQREAAKKGGEKLAESTKLDQSHGVTTMVFIPKNDEKSVYVMNIVETDGRTEVLKKGIPLDQLKQKVGDRKIVELDLNFNINEKSDFKKYFSMEVSEPISLAQYNSKKTDKFEGSFENVPYPNKLKEAFDEVLKSQHIDQSASEVSDPEKLKETLNKALDKYKELLGKVGEGVSPFKSLIEKEAHFQAVLHGLFSHYSDIKLGESPESRALILTEFQTGKGKRVDMLVHGVKFAGRGSNAKEYIPIGLELKGPREGKEADALKKEANKQITDEYKEGVTYKTLTDGDKVACVGVVFDKKAGNANSLIQLSNEKEFTPVKVVHSSIMQIGQQPPKKKFNPNSCVRPGGRSKRSVNSCLFSKDDVEKFSKGNIDENNVDKIIIDSEKFLTYVKNSQDEGKNAQLVEFVGDKSIEGDRKYLLDKVIEDQGYERYVQNERIKDLHGDIVHQDSSLTKNPKLKGRLMNAAGGIQLIRGIHGAIVSCQDGMTTDCGLNLGGMGWSFASQPIENAVVKITPKVLASAEKVVGKIPGVLGKQTKFAVQVAGVKFGSKIAGGVAGAITGVFDIVDIGISASNLVDCKKRENSDNPCGEKEIRDNIASISFSTASFVSGVALTALSMPGVGIAVGVGLMVGYGIYSGVSNIIEYEKRYDTTHGENWSIFWRTIFFQPMADDVQHLAARKDVVNSLTKGVWQALRDSPSSVVAYGIGFGEVRGNTLRPDYARILMDKEDTNTEDLSRVIPDRIPGASRICLPKITGQDYEKGITNSVQPPLYYCDNAMVISHDGRVGIKQNGKTIVYDLQNIDKGKIVGSNKWNNNFLIYPGTTRITGGNNVVNRFVVNNIDFSGKIIGRGNSVNILDLSQLKNPVVGVNVNYRFEPSASGQLKVKMNNHLLIDDYINNSSFNYHYVGRKNKVDKVLCMGYSEHFAEIDDREVIIDSGGGSSNNVKDIVENCKKVIISPYTTVEGRESNYTFYVKTAGYKGRSLRSEINIKGTGTVVFSEFDLLSDCDQITYSTGSNTLSLKINFGQDNQFTLDIKNYVEQSNNKPHFVLIDKNGSNIVPKIEKSDSSIIKINSFELHSELDNFDDVETHYKKILNNNKDYKVLGVIRGKTQNQNNSVVPHMVFGSSGDDVIHFDQGTMFARGGKGSDVYVIAGDINNKEVKIDNHSDNEKMDTLFMPEVGKDFLVQQCNLHLNYNNTSIQVKNYLQDRNYRHLVIMNKKGEAFIPDIQSMSCSSSGKGKLVPFLQATQTQNMFLLRKDFQGDHVVIDSHLEDIKKYKDKDDLLLIRESEIPFIIRIEEFYIDRSKWENISYSLWNNNDLLPSPELLENVDNVMEYKDKLRNDYERIVKEYIMDFSNPTTVIQHNQKSEKGISTFIGEDEERIGVMILKNTSPDQVEVLSSGEDLIFRDKKFNHTIKIKDWDNNESYRISKLEFDLGLEPIKILRLNRFSLSEIEEIQSLIDKASENYQSRNEYTSKVETDFKCLVSTAGFANKNSTYQCLGFSSLQDQVNFVEGFCSLEQLSEFRGDLNSTQISALSRTLQNNLLLSGYGQEVINQCSELMMNEESNQQSKVSSMVKNIIKMDLENSMLNNSPLTSSSTNGICNLDKKLCDEAMKEAVNGVYEKVDTKKMLRLIHDCSSITQSVQGYIAVFDEMQKKNDLNNNAVFKLAYYVKEIMEKDNCRSLHPEERSNLEELKSKLPESVKNVVFSSKVCIKNVKFNEDLYAVVDRLKYDDYRRNVFTWIPKTRDQQFVWEIEPYGGSFHIKNVMFNEYLYAALDFLNYDEARRRVFTWTPQTKDSQFVWKIEPYGGNLRIMNVKFNEYLYAVLDYLVHDENRRQVFTWTPQTKDSQFVWKVEDCGSTRKGCDVQEIDVSLGSDPFKAIGVKDKLNSTQELSKRLQNVFSLNGYDQNAVDKYFKLMLDSGQQVVSKVFSAVENIKELVSPAEGKLDLGSCARNNEKGNTDSCPAFMRDIHNELNINERRNISVDEKDVITSGHARLDTENFPIQEKVINDDTNGKKSLKRTLDFRQLVKQVNKDLSIKPVPIVIKDKNDLLVKLSISATDLQQDVITVRLKDALINKWYKKLQIIFDNAPVKIDDNLDLKSSFFISDEKIIVVTPQDIEEGNKLIISKKAGQYTYLHDKYDLIVTNAFNAGIEANELCIIYFRDFYKEPKMKTLSIKFIDKEILLSNEIEKIYNSDSIDKLNNVSSIINSQEGSITLEVPDSGDINARGELDRTLLHFVSRAGEFDKVKLLLDRGANIEAQDEFGYTPISLATQSGKWSVVELLLDRGANIDTQDKKGQTLLHFAVSGNNLDMIQLLLDRGANIEVQDDFGYTPILYAAQSGKWDVVKLLISNGAKFNNEITMQGTPLHFAVQEGNLDMIRFLLDEGADIESQDKDNKKPLHLAVDANRLSIVKLLLDRGASVNAKDENNKAPLDLATEEDMIEVLKKAQLDQELLINARNGNLNKVKDLIIQGANLEAKDINGNTALHNACSNGHLKVVEYLIDKGASLKAKNKDGKTPLDLAIQKGHKDIVQTIKQIQSDLNEKLLSAVKNGDLNKIEDLVSQGTSLRMKDSSSNTLLHYASQNDHLEVVEYLIEKGASLKAKNKDGKTPLDLAVQKNYKGIIGFLKKTQLDLDKELLAVANSDDLNRVKTLVSQGASLEVKDNSDNTPLHNACNNGHVKVVKYLIKKGASLKAKNKDGEAPLHVAVQHDGTLEVIEFILSRDLSGINDVTNEGRTPLHLAIRGDKSNTVELLLRKGASIAVKDKNGKTPLDLAKQEDYTNIIEMIEEVQSELDEKLLMAVKDNNLSEVGDLINRNANVNARDMYSWTPLHWAAFKGYLEVAEFLVKKGADVNAASENLYGSRPIHIAVENNNKNIIEFLLSKGVDVNDTEKQGYTPLHYAAWRGRSEVASLLFDKRANINAADTSGKKPIHVAAENNSKSIIEFLLSKGVNVDEADKNGWTPLHYAAKFDQLEVAKFLIEKGANINAADTYGKKPIHVAVENGSKNIIGFLLSKGVSVDEADKDGWTPLHWAALENRLEVTKFLVEKGANVNAEDRYGKKPIHRAATAGYKNIIEFLLSKGVSVDEVDNGWARTPLHWASNGGYLDVVKYLINKGANINAEDKNGKTPLSIAADKKHDDVVKYLLDEELLTAVQDGDLNKVQGLVNRGANLDTKDKDGKTLLHYASRSPHHLDMVKYLISKGADIDVKDNSGRTPEDEERYTNSSAMREVFMQARLDKELLITVQSSDLKTIKSLIAQDVSKDRHGAYYYAWSGNLDTVKFLVERDVNVNDTDKYDCTLLHWATLKGHLDIAKFLIGKGANVNAEDILGRKPMHFAVINNHKNIIEFFLNEKVTGVDSADKQGRTLLHWASWSGNLDMVEYLIGKGANINAKDRNGKTPLDIARDKGHNNVAEYLQQTQLTLDKQLLVAIGNSDLNKVRGLVAQGANIDTNDKNGNTPLYSAAEIGDLNLVKLLLDNGANIEAKNGEYQATPLHGAVENYRVDVVKLLLNRSANVNAKDKGDWTPLHYAADNIDLNIVELLVNADANLSAKDDHGMTPLDIARGRGHSNIIKYLEEKLNQEREKPVQRRRRYHHGGHNRHHLSRNLLAIDSSNQHEIAASSGTRPSSWINDLFSWVKSSVGGLLSSKPKEASSTPSSISQISASMDVNGTIMLLDVLVRKVTGQKYISTVDQSISPLEAQGYALNITKRFEKVLNETAIKSGISVTNLNFDPVVVQSAIVGQIISEKFSKIPKTLYSFAKEACPEFQQTDKFLVHLRSQLEGEKETALLQQKVEKPYKDLSQEVSRKVQLSKKPDTFLNGTSVVQEISRAIN